MRWWHQVVERGTINLHDFPAAKAHRFPLFFQREKAGIKKRAFLVYVNDSVRSFFSGRGLLMHWQEAISHAWLTWALTRASSCMFTSQRLLLLPTCPGVERWFLTAEKVEKTTSRNPSTLFVCCNRISRRLNQNALKMRWCDHLKMGSNWSWKVHRLRTQFSHTHTKLSWEETRLKKKSFS